MTELERRKKNFIDATCFIEPEKIPVDIEVTGWPFAYAGTTFRDEKDNPELAAKKYCKFMDDIPFDCFTLDMGFTLDPAINEELGSSEYKLAPDGVCIQHNQSNISFVPDEDYEELINNFDEYMTEKRVRQMYSVYKLPKKEAYEHVKKAAILFKKLGDLNDYIMKEIQEREKLQPLDFWGLPMYYSSLNVVFDGIRGIKNTLIDIRRRPEQLDQLLEVIGQRRRPRFNPEDFKGKNFPLADTVYHSECFISNKQFEKYYMKDLKEYFLPLMEQGVKYFLKGEGRFLNTLPYLRELPKGSMVIMVDQDDPYEVYNAIGDHHSIICGMTTDELKFGTPESCIDYAKRCVDTFAPGGGFIFGINKPLLCANDVKTENVRAVYEFMEQYSRK